jgi:phosphomethylpyrimidine synthase
MGRARKNLDWNVQAEMAMDPELVIELRGKSSPADTETCTMCGKFCAMKGVKEYL